MPPFFGLVAVILQIGLRLFVPGPFVVPRPFHLIGMTLIVVALMMNVWGSTRFERAGTTLRPFEESTVLETRGLFGISRNPMYLGAALGLLGIAVFLRAATPFLVVPLFAWWITRTFIVHEEAMLERTFGDAYRAYRSRVRRWI